CLAIVQPVSVGGGEGIVLAGSQYMLDSLPGQIAGVVAKHGFCVTVSLDDPAIIIHPEQGGTDNGAGRIGPVALDQKFFHSSDASLGLAGCSLPVLLFFYRFCHDSFIILTILPKITSCRSSLDRSRRAHSSRFRGWNRPQDAQAPAGPVSAG